MNSIRTYSELIKFSTFEERFDYLKLSGIIGQETFGIERYLNQNFYTSKEWRDFRRSIISRDYGYDLGIIGYTIPGIIIIHHMNPITIEDILNQNPYIMDPEYVISCSDLTHKAIHYGDRQFLRQEYKARTKNDTIPWR